MNLLKLWESFIDEIRAFFKEKGYTEVSTPLLLERPNLDPNVEPIGAGVRLRGQERRMWLATSPEIPMKKLLARGAGDIFQITKAFRNDEWGRLHRTEFHMLEWYAVGCDYRYLIEELKQLLGRLFGFREFEVVRMEEVFLKYFGEGIPTGEDEMKDFLRRRGIDFGEDEDWETLFYRAFIEVEKSLGRGKPTFVIDFPERLCALARVRDGWAERFELFIDGVELANGWSEEANEEEVRRRLEREAKRRGFEVDEEFVRAHGQMPPCAGCSVGLDRLFMFYVRKDVIIDFL
ncbi:MAG: elongation factor P--(R)-beta-lysine ligase [Aquificae bacterium]|nr:elongation factor P--(R)-beta-lysine ligase [Aquificota bacterium]